MVDSSNHVAASVLDFHGLLGIESDLQSWEARRWIDAAAEVKDKAAGAAAAGFAVVSVAIARKGRQNRGKEADEEAD